MKDCVASTKMKDQLLHKRKIELYGSQVTHSKFSVRRIGLSIKKKKKSQNRLFGTESKTKRISVTTTRQGGNSEIMGQIRQVD
jgi:hypothetical protein